jgi:hypothetical protein
LTTRDAAVIELGERSRVVQLVGRAAHTLARAARHSIAVGRMRPLGAAVASRPGVTILAAMGTHVALMTVGSGWRQWYWLLLPSIFCVIAVVLIASRCRVESPIVH